MSIFTYGVRTFSSSVPLTHPDTSTSVLGCAVVSCPVRSCLLHPVPALQVLNFSVLSNYIPSSSGVPSVLVLHYSVLLFPVQSHIALIFPGPSRSTVHLFTCPIQSSVLPCPIRPVMQSPPLSCPLLHRPVLSLSYFIWIWKYGSCVHDCVFAATAGFSVCASD